MMWAGACQGEKGGSASWDKYHLQSSHCCVTLSLPFNHSGLIVIPFIYPLITSPTHSINSVSTYYVPDFMLLRMYLVLTKHNQYNSLSSRHSRSMNHKQIECNTTLLLWKPAALSTVFEDGQVYKGITIVLPDKGLLPTNDHLAGASQDVLWESLAWPLLKE